jgi:hypothetical protein
MPSLNVSTGGTYGYRSPLTVEEIHYQIQQNFDPVSTAVTRVTDGQIRPV